MDELLPPGTVDEPDVQRRVQNPYDQEAEDQSTKLVEKNLFHVFTPLFVVDLTRNRN
jgi:hypothetical protein